MRLTRFILHICFVLAGLGCGQDTGKPVETPPGAAADTPAAPAPTAPAPNAAPTPEPAPAASPTPTAAAEPAKAEAEPKPAQAPAGKPAADTNAVCMQVCDRTEKLNCGPTEQCMAACAAANDGSVCGTEMSTFMSCALKHPAEHWECTDDGVAAIKDAYCDKEQAAVMSCFQQTAG